MPRWVCNTFGNRCTCVHDSWVDHHCCFKKRTSADRQKPHIWKSPNISVDISPNHFRSNPNTVSLSYSMIKCSDWSAMSVQSVSEWSITSQIDTNVKRYLFFNIPWCKIRPCKHSNHLHNSQLIAMGAVDERVALRIGALQWFELQIMIRWPPTSCTVYCTSFWGSIPSGTATEPN